jgi:hypothetical protein
MDGGRRGVIVLFICGILNGWLKVSWLAMSIWGKRLEFWSREVSSRFFSAARRHVSAPFL